MFARDLMEDWPLLPFEETKVKDGTKALFLCTDEIYKRTNTFFHINGLSLVTVTKFKSSFKSLTDKQLDKFGVVPGVVSASCESPKMFCYRYDNWNRSDCTCRRKAIEAYFKNHPELNLDMATEYNFIETLFYPFYFGKPDRKRNSIDQERLNRPHGPSHLRY